MLQDSFFYVSTNWIPSEYRQHVAEMFAHEQALLPNQTCANTSVHVLRLPEVYPD